MPRLMVSLDPQEERALFDVARRERRKPPQQIAYVLRQWLEREKLLPNVAATGPARPEGSAAREA